MAGINKKEFDVLSHIEQCTRENTPFYIPQNTQLAPKAFEEVQSKLAKEGFIQDECLTEKGLQALEPFRVKRAVLLAAGKGARLAPITDKIPKPLIDVNGKAIIETIIEALLKAEVAEIVVVTGYKAEQFDILQKKYAAVKLVHNPLYNTTNTISSALAVKDKLCAAYIIESDILIKNSDIIKKYQYACNYLSAFFPRLENEWCFDIEGPRMVNIRVDSGVNIPRLFGISFWSESDGKKLAKHLEELYATDGGKDCYWDHAPTKFYSDAYEIYYRMFDADDLAEIDTYAELQKLDKKYK